MVQLRCREPLSGGWAVVFRVLQGADGIGELIDHRGEIVFSCGHQPAAQCRYANCAESPLV